MDITAISAGAAGGPVAPGASLGAPDPADLETFNGIYGAGRAEGAAAPSVADGIKQGLEGLERTHDSQVHALQDALRHLSRGDLSAPEMLQVQMRLNELTVTETYAMKLGEKGDEGIKTLIANQ